MRTDDGRASGTDGQTHLQTRERADDRTEDRIDERPDGRSSRFLPMCLLYPGTLGFIVKIYSPRMLQIVFVNIIE